MWPSPERTYLMATFVTVLLLGLFAWSECTPPSRPGGYTSGSREDHWGSGSHSRGEGPESRESHSREGQEGDDDDDDDDDDDARQWTSKRRLTTNPPGSYAGRKEVMASNQTRYLTLSGSSGSVCSRQVYQSEYRTERVGYPCWKSVRVRCGDCGAACRRVGKLCYKQTATTCHRQERRCIQAWVMRYYCCSGYRQLGRTCQATHDLHCQQNNGGCDHLCRTDRYGRKICECFPGYRPVHATRCEDVNECSQRNGACNQGCKNTDGSFYCVCRNGFRLKDPLTCQEINECATSNGGCAHQCHNTWGAFYCECDHGFKRIRGSECKDIDECSSAPCSHRCANLPGTYACYCPKTYRLNPKDNTTCLPIFSSAGGSPKTSDVETSNAAAKPGAISHVYVIVGSAAGGALVILLVSVLICFLLCKKSPERVTSTRTTRSTTSSATSTFGGSARYHDAGHAGKAVTGSGMPFDNNAYKVEDGDRQVAMVPAGFHRAPMPLPPSYVEATRPTAPPLPLPRPTQDISASLELRAAAVVGGYMSLTRNTGPSTGTGAALRGESTGKVSAGSSSAGDNNNDQTSESFIPTRLASTASGAGRSTPIVVHGNQHPSGMASASGGGVYEAVDDEVISASSDYIELIEDLRRSPYLQQVEGPSDTAKASSTSSLTPPSTLMTPSPPPPPPPPLLPSVPRVIITEASLSSGRKNLGRAAKKIPDVNPNQILANALMGLKKSQK